MQSRRGFLKMLGLGAAAVAVGPAVLRLAAKPKVVTGRYYSTGIGGFDRMNRMVMEHLAKHNPYAGLLDSKPFNPADYHGEMEWQAVSDGSVWRDTGAARRSEVHRKNTPGALSPEVRAIASNPFALCAYAAVLATPGAVEAKS